MQISRRLAAEVDAATREVGILRQRSRSGGARESAKLEEVISKRVTLRRELAESVAKEKALVEAASTASAPPPPSPGTITYLPFQLFSRHFLLKCFLFAASPSRASCQFF